MYELIHADCLDYLSKMGDNSVDLIVTDPPYQLIEIDDYFSHIVRVLKTTGSLYVFGDKNVIAEHWFSKLKIKHKQLLIWHYRNSPKPRGRWRMSMQGIIYGYKDASSCFHEDEARVPYLESTTKLHGRVRPSPGRMTEARKYDTSKGALPRDVIDCPALLGHLSHERLGHPDQKPLRLVEKLVRSSSSPGDLVFDPFMGTGTTILAAVKNGRKAIGIERDEAYYQVCIDRMKRYEQKKENRVDD
jgi:DNA modification methylase